MLTKARQRTMTTKPPARRGQTQHRILVSEFTAQAFEAAALAQIRESVMHLERPATKKAVGDAVVAVALRHADEVTAELLRMYGVTPSTDTDGSDTNGDEDE